MKPVKPNNHTSIRLLARAQKSVTGGASSTMRAFKEQHPLVVDRCDGPYVWDCDGNRLIDLNMGYGPLIFGHRPPKIIEAMKNELDRRGAVLGFVHETSHCAAELIKKSFPSIDTLRFCSTGTEAAQTAVRLARAVTGRPSIILFEGHYHGSSDAVFHRYHASVEELTQRRIDQVIPGTGGMGGAPHGAFVLPWNDRESVCRLFAERGDEIAAVIMEPVSGNAGVICPEDGYLEAVREVTQRCGALLIFDEVITGFRIARGGAQERYGVNADITMLSKAMGAGSVAAAIGSREEVMAKILEGEVFHGGVYSASPINMAGVLAAQEEFDRNADRIFDHLEQVSDHLVNGVREIFARHDMPVVVQNVGPMLSLAFVKQGSPSRLTSYRQLRSHADACRYVEFHHRMRERGVFVHANYLEPWYLSTAHTHEVIDDVLVAAAAVARQMA